MKINKRIGSLAGTVLVSAVIVGVMQADKGDATTEPPIVTEVTRHGEVLDNHEDRLTNVESDVKVLQENTNTPQSTNKVAVREVRTQAPSEPIHSPTAQSSAVAEAPPPKVTIVSYQQITVDANTTDCEITYSDGTTKRWTWRKTWMNQGTLQGTEDGRCDPSLIGEEKS